MNQLNNKLYAAESITLLQQGHFTHQQAKSFTQFEAHTGQVLFTCSALSDLTF